MSSAAYPMPSRIDRVQRGGLAVGAAGLALCALGFFASPAQFYRSYLLAYLFWIGIAVGCMSIMMIHHLSGGMWGLVIRRILEAGSRTLRFALVFFLPVAAGLPHIYSWADGARLAEDEALHKAVAAKAVYLNSQSFLARALFYFAVWFLLQHFLNKWSLELDAGENRKVSRRLRGLSGGGLVLMGLTITFASVDWAMSLEPEWFSTIYGLLFIVGQALSAMSLVIIAVSLLGGEKPLSDVVRPGTVHDLGKLLFAFVMLWAYVNVSQFIIVWSGNIPEEIPWYMHRLHGGWQVVALMLVVFHFVLPFLVLLSRDLKRNPRLLGTVAASLLFLRLVDLFWLVGPELHPHGFAIHWLDVAAAAGVGGIWLALFAGQLKGRPLIPLGEPEIRELLEEARG